MKTPSAEAQHLAKEASKIRRRDLPSHIQELMMAYEQSRGVSFEGFLFNVAPPDSDLEKNGGWFYIDPALDAFAWVASLNAAQNKIMREDGKALSKDWVLNVFPHIYALLANFDSILKNDKAFANKAMRWFEEAATLILEGEGEMPAKSPSDTSRDSKAAATEVIKLLAAAEERARREENLGKVEIVRSPETKRIVLPDGMPTRDGITWLERQAEHEETEVSIHIRFNVFPFDGARALGKAMHDRYGYARGEKEFSMMGMRPPTLLEVEVSHGVFEQIIWGKFTVPGIDGSLETSSWAENPRKGPFMFALEGQIKRKHEAEIQALATVLREYLERDSIYRGKALRLPPTSGEMHNIGSPPKFLDLSHADESLIFNDDTMQDIRALIFTPIEQTRWCQEHKCNLKRGTLLAGPYGVGKTLTAHMVAKKAQDNGWTFLYVEDTSGMIPALRFAQQYLPAVIFAEDIDRVVGLDRDEEANAIMNTIDDVEVKGSHVFVILTTNHPDKIHPAMLRKGRMDTIITITPPDEHSVERLLRAYGRDTIPHNADLTEVRRMLAGQIPASIKEVAERAKLYAIANGAREHLTLSGSDLLAAARQLLRETPAHESEAPKHPATQLGEAMQEVIQEVIREALR